MKKRNFFVCNNCGIKFTDSKHLKRKYCSRKCYAFNIRGTGKSHIRIRINGNRVYLHRLLAEGYLRPLADGEIVHHKNGNKFDNSIGNLEILPSQSHHLQIHYQNGDGIYSGKSLQQIESDFAEYGF